MAFRKHSACHIRQRYRESTAILESKHKGSPHEFGDVFVRWDIDRTFDSMPPGDRHSIP